MTSTCSVPFLPLYINSMLEKPSQTLPVRRARQLLISRQTDWSWTSEGAMHILAHAMKKLIINIFKV